jgi:iron complex transport system substrate-binding protein
VVKETLKALSFLPASTHIIYELGLQEQLYGVTFECPSDKPKVVRSYLEGNQYSSLEINELVKEHVSMNKPLYYIDMELLEEAQPDIIFTQHVCDVCQIGTSFVEQAVSQLNKQPKIVPLVPRRLNDIFDNVLTIATELGYEYEGTKLVDLCHQRINRLQANLSKHVSSSKKVMFIEWIEPIFSCGHWIPEQIMLAGGFDPLSAEGGYSTRTDWDRVKHANPEIIVIAPCGFSIDRAYQEMDKLTALKGWSELTAVQNNQIYIVDANLFTRPSTSLVDGIELLAGIFHPNSIIIPNELQHKVMNYNNDGK